jgi:hypothetical protein
MSLLAIELSFRPPIQIKQSKNAGILRSAARWNVSTGGSATRRYRLTTKVTLFEQKFSHEIEKIQDAGYCFYLASYIMNPASFLISVKIRG